MNAVIIHNLLLNLKKADIIQYSERLRRYLIA